MSSGLSIASIEDLLTEGTEPKPAPRVRRSGIVGTVVLSVVTAAVLALGIFELIAALGYHVPYAFLSFIVLALVAGVRSVMALWPPKVPRMTAATTAPNIQNPDRPFAEAQRWVDRLEWIRGDVKHFRQALAPAIEALVDQRLRVRYGLTRESHPARAADLLGPRLVQFLDFSTLRRVPKPAELSDFVTELEEL